MTQTELKIMLIALRVALIGQLIVLPLAVALMDFKTASIDALLIMATIYAYYSINQIKDKTK
jgi:hypothetical protein